MQPFSTARVEKPISGAHYFEKPLLRLFEIQQKIDS